MCNTPTGVKATPIFGFQNDLTHSEPLVLNAEPEWRVRFCAFKPVKFKHAEEEKRFRLWTGLSACNANHWCDTVVEAKNDDVGNMLFRISVNREYTRMEDTRRFSNMWEMRISGAPYQGLKPLLKSIHYENIRIYAKGHSQLQTFERNGFPPNTEPDHDARFGQRLNLNLNAMSGPGSVQVRTDFRSELNLATTTPTQTIGEQRQAVSRKTLDQQALIQ
ncbi:hypothetical protein K438DRAFT_1771548 [Mycena galopus ATCC 62051]|nr:hypothetical protein K438DRAFT_1771548 [Mycena galopus ATCC 62051]